jgi:hypothetical protein
MYSPELADRGKHENATAKMHDLLTAFSVNVKEDALESRKVDGIRLRQHQHNL